MAYVLGVMQFFVLEQLTKAQGPGSRDWVIQLISAVVTIGTVVIYPISGPLAASFAKRYVMAVAAILAAAVFGIAGSFGWWPDAWLYLALMGLLLGIYNAAKMASVPLAATQSGRSTTAVNGGMSVVFLLAILLGFPSGTWLYSLLPAHGHMVAALLMIGSGALALRCRFEAEVQRPFVAEEKRVLRDTWGLFRRHGLFLTAGPLMWGIASAAQMAAIALLVQRRIVTPQVASFLPFWAAVGAIAGTVISPLFLRARFCVATLCAALMAALLPFVPWLTRDYTVVAGGVVLMGVLFGTTTNLIDSALLERVGAEGKEGTGAAVQSAMLAFAMVFASGTVGVSLQQGWITPKGQFIILAVLTLVAALLAFILALQYEIGAGGVLSMLAPLVRLLLALRYKIRVIGLDHAHGLRGALILPNHPAEIDPVILEVILWQALQPRPVVTEDFFDVPVLRKLFLALRALPVPNLEIGRSTFKMRRLDATMRAISDGIQRGDNILLYPSGGLMRQPRTRIGGASGTHALLQEMPDVPILLVRTRGLWGSSFSCWAKAQRPELLAVLRQAWRALLLNLIVFMPRRAVTIELCPAPADLPRTADRTTLNAWLEAWYNRAGDEPLALVPYSVWTRALPKAAHERSDAAAEIEAVPREIVNSVKEELARMRKCAPDDITPAASLRNDLGFDSLEMAEVLAWLDARFDKRDVVLADIPTVGAVIRIAAGYTMVAAEERATVATPRAWFDVEQRGNVSEPRAATVPACLLHTCDRLDGAAACADAGSGVVTYRQFKRSALALAQYIRTLPGDRLGVMLPASVAADIAVFATMLAGKTPVMINWTLGARTARHALRSARVQHILTSLRFADNIDTLPFDDIESQLLFLERIRATGITAGMKLRAAAQCCLRRARLLRVLGLDALDPNSTAVILFTSGSESVPKGVPLSHANLLSNIAGVCAAAAFTRCDCVLGFLPPFHSFGLTATLLLPLVCGLRVAHYPNPTEARRIAQAIAAWQATLTAGTPTFLKTILQAGTTEMFTSLRLLVSGAEKAPQALFDLAAQCGIPVVREGYGITECAPIVSLCRPDDDRPEGVGRPLPGVELCVVQPDTLQPLPNGEQGLILVAGPNVFGGYLEKNVATPFVEASGRRWYNTGDLGYLTPRGNLVIAGRLKRFVKSAGEMISLPALEDVLLATWPHREDGPGLAIIAQDVAGQRPQLHLFTVYAITEAQANAALQAAGFSTIARLSAVHTVPALPVLGTGKTDYRALQAQLAADTTT